MTQQCDLRRRKVTQAPSVLRSMLTAMSWWHIRGRSWHAEEPSATSGTTHWWVSFGLLPLNWRRCFYKVSATVSASCQHN